MSDAMDTQPLFSCRELTKTYTRSGRTTHALAGVDLDIAVGDQLGVVGESGSGKSTLIRMLCALDRPTSGTVTFRGQRIERARSAQLADLRSTVALVFQDPRSSLDPRMKVGAIVAEPLTSPLLRRHPDVPKDVPGRVAEVLSDVGLEPEMVDRFPHEFSGGQRQRIAIARALATRPQVLVADEPVSALDVSVRAQVLNLLTELVNRQDLTMVFISHDLAVVRHLCERVVVLRRGQIVEQGPIERVWGEPASDYTRELLAARPTLPTFD